MLMAICPKCGLRMAGLEYDDYKKRECLHCLSCGWDGDIISRVSERRRNRLAASSRQNDRPWGIGQANGKPILPGQRKRE